VPFSSILFENVTDMPAPQLPADSPFLADLNLDQVCAAMTFGREQYDLAPYFLTPLPDESAIGYRHQVVRDLRDERVRTAVTSFARGMAVMRQGRTTASRLRHPHQRQRWFLDAAGTYTRAVLELAEQLRQAELGSAGMRSLREYLAAYVRSAGYQQLTADVTGLLDRLGEVRYCVHVRGARVRVTRYDGESDYGAEVEQTFAKFAQGAVTDYRVKFRTQTGMDDVEAQILDCVAQLWPELFADLEEFGRRHDRYADDVVTTFDREVQFYLGYLDHIRSLESAGLAFCFPEVSTTSKQLRVDDAFDLALASKLTGRRTVVGTSCTTWPAWACRYPGGRPSCSSPTGSSPTSRRKRACRTCAASSRTS
jgi:DNA mismatch repair protein MutS